MHRILPALTAALLLATAPPTLAAPAQDERPSRPLIDLTFPGGTATEYLDALRGAVEGANIIVGPDVQLVRLQPIELQQVDLESAVALMHGMRLDLNDRIVELSVDSEGPRSARGRPVYMVHAQVAVKNARHSARASEVWSVGRVLEGGIGPEDLMTAVETALDLFGHEYEPADVRFHADTRLVLARGFHEQIQTINSVIDALAQGAHHEDLERQMRHEMERTQQDAARAVARMEDQTQHAEQQRQMEMTRLEQEYRLMVRELETRIAQLEAELAQALKRQE